MSDLQIIRRDWWEREDPGVVMLRVVAPNRIPLLTSEVTSLIVEIYDMTAPADLAAGGRTPLATLTPTIGNPEALWFDTLQKNDGYWQKDQVGYNARHYTKATDAVFVPEHLHRFEFRVVTAAFPTKWGEIVGIREGVCMGREGV